MVFFVTCLVPLCENTLTKHSLFISQKDTEDPESLKDNEREREKEKPKEVSLFLAHESPPTTKTGTDSL